MIYVLNLIKLLIHTPNLLMLLLLMALIYGKLFNDYTSALIAIFKIALVLSLVNLI
ncbi:TPA: hypothetical protein ACGA33_000882 [Clostridium perfringens]